MLQNAIRYLRHCHIFYSNPSLPLWTGQSTEKITLVSCLAVVSASVAFQDLFCLLWTAKKKIGKKKESQPLIISSSWFINPLALAVVVSLTPVKCTSMQIITLGKGKTALGSGSGTSKHNCGKGSESGNLRECLKGQAWKGSNKTWTFLKKQTVLMENKESSCRHYHS